jgi:hypothetical protein
LLKEKILCDGRVTDKRVLFIGAGLEALLRPAVLLDKLPKKA